jgi:hypothetical protein
MNKQINQSNLRNRIRDLITTSVVFGLFFLKEGNVDKMLYDIEKLSDEIMELINKTIKQ